MAVLLGGADASQELRCRLPVSPAIWDGGSRLALQGRLPDRVLAVRDIGAGRTWWTRGCQALAASTT
jgi:hypothetical protein